MQAALAQFQGEVVAVRPRVPEGEEPVKGFGNIMKEAQKLQEQMEPLQEEVGQEEGRGHRGRRHGDGGGQRQAGDRRRSRSIREVINKDDAQMLEDLVLAACNEALRKSREIVQQEMGKITGGLKIPGLGM